MTTEDIMDGLGIGDERQIQRLLQSSKLLRRFHGDDTFTSQHLGRLRSICEDLGIELEIGSNIRLSIDGKSVEL